MTPLPGSRWPGQRRSLPGQRSRCISQPQSPGADDLDTRWSLFPNGRLVIETWYRTVGPYPIRSWGRYRVLEGDKLQWRLDDGGGGHARLWHGRRLLEVGTLADEPLRSDRVSSFRERPPPPVAALGTPDEEGWADYTPPLVVGAEATDPAIDGSTAEETAALLAAWLITGEEPGRPSGLPLLMAGQATASELLAELREAGVERMTLRARRDLPQGNVRIRADVLRSGGGIQGLALELHFVGRHWLLLRVQATP